MIVCSCNVIRRREIEAAVAAMHASGEQPLATPGAVFRCLNARPRCGGCLPHVASIAYAAQQAIATSEDTDFVADDRAMV